MGTVVVLPSFDQDQSMWQDVKLGHRQLQIVDYAALDIDTYTFDNVVQAVVQLVKSAPQPVILAGEDFGALVALKAAVYLLGRLDRLLLVRPHFQGSPSVVSAGLFHSGPLSRTDENTLKKSLRHLDLTNDLMHVQGATFIFTGENDHKNKQVALDLKNRLIDGHLAVVPGMGKKLNDEGVHALSENLR